MMETLNLPEPVRDGSLSLEKAIQERRSTREFKPDALTFKEITQIVWIAQGTVQPGMRRRNAPSAGACYPMEILVAAGYVEGLAQGVYRYQPEAHALAKIADGDARPALHVAALQQDSVRKAPAIIIIGAVFERVTNRYGERGERYVHMEAGNVAQNISLQVVALGLGTVLIGAFEDSAISQAASLPEYIKPLCLMPIGRR